MKEAIRYVLANRGIKVSTENLIILEKHWGALVHQRSRVQEVLLADSDIALRHIPGGDHID